MSMTESTRRPRRFCAGLLRGHALLVGFWISRARCIPRICDAYFLGGNNVPWYMLGLSDASGMFDISGTMVMVAWLFVYGLKSIWMPWLWPVFNQIFMMVYCRVWLRRSSVMTGAEWIRFRFGEGTGSHLSHLVVVLYAMLIVIGFLAYGFMGIGKFAATMLPWQLSADPAVNNNLYGLIITALTSIYVVKGGMLSVVFTEVMQFRCDDRGCIWSASSRCKPCRRRCLRRGAGGLGFDLLSAPGSTWIGPASSIGERENQRRRLGILLRVLHDRVGQGLAAEHGRAAAGLRHAARALGPHAARGGADELVGERRAAIPRYMMITGITVLALAFFTDELAIGRQLRRLRADPAAGAARCSSARSAGPGDRRPDGRVHVDFAATVNAAPAYIVNDIYKRYINPDTPRSERTSDELRGFDRRGDHRHRDRLRHDIAQRHRGVDHGRAVRRLHGVQRVEMVLVAVQRLRLLLAAWSPAWSRVAIVPRACFPNLAVIYSLSADSGGFACRLLVASLLTPPEDVAVLKQFYCKPRPWGFWGPIHELVVGGESGRRTQHGVRPRYAQCAGRHRLANCADDDCHLPRAAGSGVG